MDGFLKNHQPSSSDLERRFWVPKQHGIGQGKALVDSQETCSRTPGKPGGVSSVGCPGFVRKTHGKKTWVLGTWKYVTQKIEKVCQMFFLGNQPSWTGIFSSSGRSCVSPIFLASCIGRSAGRSCSGQVILCHSVREMKVSINRGSPIAGWFQ